MPMRTVLRRSAPHVPDVIQADLRGQDDPDLDVRKAPRIPRTPETRKARPGRSGIVASMEVIKKAVKKLKLTRPEPSEAIILAAVGEGLAWLKARGKVGRFWRNNTGAYLAGMGKKKRFVRFGEVGSGDYLGWLTDGRFFSIECKRFGEEQTPEQIKFGDELTAAGGVYAVVHSVDELFAVFSTRGS